MKISALDWRNLSALYQDLADATLAYRIANSKSLTIDQKNSLNLHFGRLLNASESFADEALKQAMSDIDASVESIQTSAHDAIAAIHSVNEVKNVLDITVAAIGLSAAMLSPTPGTIATALDGLVQALGQAQTVTG